jgi:hypothetical protein
MRPAYPAEALSKLDSRLACRASNSKLRRSQAAAGATFTSKMRVSASVS